MTDWSWTALAVLAVGSYVFKLTGLVVLGDRQLPVSMTRVLALLPAALFGALIVVSTFAGDRELVLDARAAGLAAASVAVWRRANFVVVVVVAAVATAVVRAAS